MSGVRVCLASSWYPHADNPYHCIFVHEYAKRIYRAGAKVFVLTTIRSIADKEFVEKEGIPILRVELKAFLGVLNPSILLNFLKVFRKADIIHVHAIDIFGAISTLITGCPSLVNI